MGQDPAQSTVDPIDCSVGETAAVAAAVVTKIRVERIDVFRRQLPHRQTTESWGQVRVDHAAGVTPRGERPPRRVGGVPLLEQLPECRVQRPTASLGDLREPRTVRVRSRILPVSGSVPS